MTRETTFLYLAIGSLATASARGADPADFARDVQPLLKAHCVKCHGERKQQGGLRFDGREGAFVETDSGEPAIVPGKADRSELIRRVLSRDETDRMPPVGAPLSAAQAEVLRRWIDAGATWPEDASPATGGRKEMIVSDEDRQHWSFRPLRPVELPPVQDAGRVQSPVDRFILAALAARMLTPTAAAAPRTLIRRLYFDLIGLPPTPEDVNAFCASAAHNRQSAIDTLVDRLLGSRHYGERWGRHWLDVARYADSDGMEEDFDRPNAYRYRDFVIRALDEDLPFDTFVRWQIAGDEIDPDNPLAVSATGFLAAGPRSVLPDKLLKEERLFTRYNELDDMLSTLGTGLPGLTLGCARCHDHKYDPVPTRDYYRLLAVLQSGDRSDVPLGPRAGIEDSKRRRAAWQQEVKAAEGKLTGWLKEQEKPFEPALRAEKIAALPVDDAQKALLRDQPGSDAARQLAKKHEKALRIGDGDFRRMMDDAQRRRWDELAKAVAAARGREPEASPLGFAFKDFGAEPKPSWLFRRGNFRDREIAVTLGSLSVLTNGRSPEEYWQQARAERPLPDSTYQRRALAGWIADVEHGAGALLARVIVNRVWQHHFGTGLVATVNDLGTQGERPSHPDLLEWLTYDFVSHGWRLKRLHRLILTSASWQQGTSFDAARARVDPENRLLWRRRPQRLEAEILRDSLLAISGTLNPEPYGPGFKPPIAREAMIGRNIKNPYPTDVKDTPAVRRRSVYMFHKRLVPDPLLQAFDKPGAQQSCGRRDSTTVAPQALALLNDPFVRVRALDFADRLLEANPDDPGHQVDHAYRLALGRPPRDPERSESVAFVGAQILNRARRDGKVAPSQVRREALADFCQALFSLNEFLYVD